MEKSSVDSISPFVLRRRPDSVTADLCVVLSLLSLCLNNGSFKQTKKYYVFWEIFLFVFFYVCFNAPDMNTFHVSERHYWQ